MPKKYKYKKSFTYEGQRYYVRADNLKDIPAKMAAKIEHLKRTRTIVSGDMSLRSWAQRCIDTYKAELTGDSKRKYENRMENGILKHLGSRPLKKITPIECQKVMNLQSGKSRTQVNEIFYTMRFLFKMAFQNHLIEADPTEYLQKPKAGQSQNRRALTSRERMFVIKVGSKDRRFYLFLLMLFCGCRPAEASECKGSDIAIMSGYPVLHIRGKKTKNADRYVPVPDEFYKIIKDTPKKEYIAAFDGGRKIEYGSRHSVWKLFWNEVNRQMGCETKRGKLLEPYPFPKDLSPYCLRHEYCTDLARKGIDVRVAQKLMGHATIQMTANIYTNLDNDDILTAAKVLAADKPSVDVHDYDNLLDPNASSNKSLS